MWLNDLLPVALDTGRVRYMHRAIKRLGNVHCKSFSTSTMSIADGVLIELPAITEPITISISGSQKVETIINSLVCCSII
jgi:hypothetical protein